jgi:predicted CXXCH cytochrome family protein
MAGHRPGQAFDESLRLALLEEGLYHPDGQIDDEVYVYGSFLQSKMHEAGVVCSNCHEPHSTKLRAEGNAVCTQCHLPAHFDDASHHRHPPGSPGAGCVNCHMPVKTYMVVDDRHDHGFRIPQPQLTLDLGVPNTCNQCHVDEGPEWARDALLAWGVSGRPASASGTGHARSFSDAWSGRNSALPRLLELAARGDVPAFIRASAALTTNRLPAPEIMPAIQPLLRSESAMVRAAAVRSMDWMPPAQRYALLQDLVSDRSRLVRMAVARQLSAVPVGQLPPEQAGALRALLQEYLGSLQFNADMPEEQINLGLLYGATGNAVAAERAYRTALELSPQFVPALINLADLYRANGMDDQAEPLLIRAIGLAPSGAPAHHAMGLLRVRQSRLAEALPYLGEARRLDPENLRYAYVYGVALWESGQREAAVGELESSLQEHPGNNELVSALASYYQAMGEEEKLQRLLQTGRP